MTPSTPAAPAATRTDPLAPIAEVVPMNAAPPPARRARVPWGLVGMLGLVALVELAVARHRVDFATHFAEDWRQTGRAARSRAVDKAVLCFGDSLVKFGVQPRVLRQLTGEPAYNLALYRGQAPSSYFLLRRALEAGARPKAVIFDADPHLLEEDPLSSVRQWAELGRLRDAWELARAAGDVSFFGRVALARLLPSVRARFEVRDFVLRQLRGEPIESYDSIPRLRRNWRLNLGAQLMPPNPTFDPAVINTYVPNGWFPRPVNLDYVRRFLDLAESRGITVYWLLPPHDPRVQASRERGRVDGAYSQFVVGMLGQHRNLVVVDGRHSGYDRATLYDATHLDRRGAVTLSAELAGILARPVPPEPGDRWVPLPPFRDHLVGLHLEDLLQSHFALHPPDGAPTRR